MAVFNLYNLCKMPCILPVVVILIYMNISSKHHQLLVEVLLIYVNYKLNISQV